MRIRIWQQHPQFGSFWGENGRFWQKSCQIEGGKSQIAICEKLRLVIQLRVLLNRQIDFNFALLLNR